MAPPDPAGAPGKPWWQRLLDALIDQSVTPAGGVGGHVWIGGTGYDAAKERTMDAAKLDALCLQLVAAPDLQPAPDGRTFCNFAIQRAAAAYGCRDLDHLMANDMAAQLPALPGWRQVGGARAAMHALAGGLAIAAKAYPAHGHVAVVAPRACEYSGSWGRSVPVVANVGRQNGFMKCSQAFPVAEGEPLYFAYGETA